MSLSEERDQSFTDEEVNTIFGLIEKVFGSKEASRVGNEVLATLRAYGGDARTFNRAVVGILANGVRGT